MWCFKPKTMETNARTPFMQATKGKIIIGFLFAFLALGMAWATSKFVFRKMLGTVEQLAAPNERIRLVNKLSHQIAGLDQLQKEKAFDKMERGQAFQKESTALRHSLDTLAHLYAENPAQLKRIRAIQALLTQRNKQFQSYLDVRENLTNTASFSEEVQKLTALMAAPTRKVDSAVLTTSTSTTMLVPDSNQTKGFLSRLFGKKKADVYRIIKEEYRLKRDTLNALNEDSIMRSIDHSLRDIEQEQRLKTEKFLKREYDLLSSGHLLTQQMLQVLREVEAEALTQMEANAQQAKGLVSAGVNRIMIIIIAFCIITLVLGYLILLDMRRINRYRRALEQAKDEALNSGRAKQRFLSNMSHEIRTPLQSILGYAEQLLHQPVPAQKDVKAVYQSALHLLQIVNEVLDFNRINSGKFSFEYAPFNLLQTLNEVLLAVQPLAQKKGLRLEHHFDAEADRGLIGDAFRLRQILFNLLGNAIKFTSDGSVDFNVHCKIQGQDLYADFYISDTGIGFDAAAADSIFNAFEQLPQSDYALVAQGTGLGLAIVRSLVESQQGRVYVKSQPGEGATFSVHLKYTLSEQDVQNSSSPALPAPSFEGTVWVIDDDRMILDLCGLILSTQGIRFQLFDTAEALLQTPIPGDLGFVLIDLRLPDMSGLALCRKLKGALPAQVSCIAMTAQVFPEERAELLSEGFDGVLLKPFRAADLLGLFVDGELADAAKVSGPGGNPSTAVAAVSGAGSAPPAGACSVAGSGSVLDPSTTRGSVAAGSVDSAVAQADAIAGSAHPAGTVIFPKPLRVNAAVLQQMTYGDTDAMAQIWARFREDCQTDIAAMYVGLREGQWEEVARLTHRLAGRTAQMGVEDVPQLFRRVEQMLHQNRTLEASLVQQIRDALSALQALIDLENAQSIP